MNAYYYNDNDPFCAQWLRNLIAAGAIPPGYVDERSIAEVEPGDLRGFAQCHFFSGIAGWAYALQLAGWGDRPVWTGSCPCQPFSSAGRRQGADDSRHLWPVWFRLIRECRPPIIFGEQVASANVIGRQGEETAAALRDLGSQAEPGVSPGAPREGEGEEEEDRLRSGFLHHGDTEADQRWGLRSDWPATEPRRWANLGQSLSRPDRPEGAVPLFEFAGGLPCDQQRHGRLGRAALDPISLGDLGEEKGEVERLIAAVGDKFDGQVEWAWLDRVRSDLEGIGYTFGAAVLGAHSVGAPHIRQRLFWVAQSDGAGRQSAGAAGTYLATSERGAAGGMADADAAGSDRQRRQGLSGDGDAPQRHDADRRGEAGWLAYSHERASGQGRALGNGRDHRGDALEGAGSGGGSNAGTLGNADITRSQGRRIDAGEHAGQLAAGETGADGPSFCKWFSVCHDPNLCDGQHCIYGDGGPPGYRWDDSEGWVDDAAREQMGRARQPWQDSVWLPCLDGKARRVERGILPLATGLPTAVDGLGPVSRVGALRGSGNAITPQAAAEFIRAVLDIWLTLKTRSEPT